MTIVVRRAVAERHQCVHTRIWWDLAWSDRIVEASAASAPSGLELDAAATDLRLMARIGGQARDVLGGRAATWRLVEWSLPIIRLVWSDLPRRPRWRDVQPLVDVAVGGALVSLRAALPDPPADPDRRDALEQLRGIVVRGALVALRRVVDDTSNDLLKAGVLLANEP